MARIVLNTYMVRYPLGGMISWSLQYLLGFKRLGHEVYVFEHAGWSNACYNPVALTMSDDPSYGMRVCSETLARYGLPDRLCYRDLSGKYYGLSRPVADEIIRTADLIIDTRHQEQWQPESHFDGIRVLLAGEPGFQQIRMARAKENGEELPSYDLHFSAGPNVGSGRSSAPTAGLDWHPMIHPVVTDLFTPHVSRSSGRFTTIMHWRSYECLTYDGVTYGHKDIEFERFVDLPGRVSVPVEVGVSGKEVPSERLRALGWLLREPNSVTMTYEDFGAYVSDSMGEFTVCKNGYVAMRTGWFSDRSGVYLACGRPVVAQDTGFSDHLPCGAGLFAVNDVEEAAAAINEIDGNYEYHSRAAREIAVEYLDARKTLARFLNRIGIA